MAAKHGFYRLALRCAGIAVQAGDGGDAVEGRAHGSGFVAQVDAEMVEERASAALGRRFTQFVLRHLDR
ncbi:hypothetical protein [Massilia antarctica]|uniref:hypothetical protein n=1 Tax=Massilia antarctica TaxID=2765360 RepID=UPI0006BB85E1|nr:hypothetical protein [Massilia sp. H27-R4]MCY0915712.1 hypothetical protein [Massilia sp. H27-R4]